MTGRSIVFAAILLSAALCVAMLVPYLPGRFDGSAAALSFAVQVASYASLLFVPVGLAWLVNPRRVALWRRLALGVTGFTAFAAALGSVAMEQLSPGVLVGGGTFILLRTMFRGSRPAAGVDEGRSVVPIALVFVPVLLVAFRATVIPRAAEWSRDRAIRHSAPLIAALEAFHERRGHYPVSLRSLNRDVPTGVIGIDRFEYEPSGESYNLFFIRPHVQLDAMEVVLFNPRDEHRFTSHEMDILQYDGEDLDRRRGDRRRTRLAQPHWISILFD